MWKGCNEEGRDLRGELRWNGWVLWGEWLREFPKTKEKIGHSKF